MPNRLRAGLLAAVTALAAGCTGGPPPAPPTVIPFDDPPRAVKKVAPVVSEESADLVDTVILRITISEEGRVSRVEVYEARHEILANAAAEAVRRWEFEPATRNGEPAVSTMLVPFPFGPVDESP